MLKTILKKCKQGDVLIFKGGWIYYSGFTLFGKCKCPEDIDIKVDALTFKNIINKIDSYELKQKDGVLIVKSTSSSVKIKGITSDVVPFSHERPDKIIKIDLSDVISIVGKYVARKSFNTMLTNIIVNISGGNLRAYGTDGFQCIRYTKEFESDNMNLLLPKDEASIISEVGECFIGTKYGKLFIRDMDGNEIIILCMDGTYDLESRIAGLPSGTLIKCNIDLEKYKELVKIISIDDGVSASLKGKDGKLSLSSHGIKIEIQEDIGMCEGDFECNVNIVHLSNLLEINNNIEYKGGFIQSQSDSCISFAQNYFINNK